MNSSWIITEGIPIPNLMERQSASALHFIRGHYYSDRGMLLSNRGFTVKRSVY